MSTRDRLDRDEAELAALLDALPRPSPAAELDARILREAREAVAPGRGGRRRWHWGGAAAAALVLLAVAPQLWRPGGQFAPPQIEVLQAPGESVRADSATLRTQQIEESADAARVESDALQAPPPLDAEPAALPPPPAPAPPPASEPRPSQESISSDREAVAPERQRSRLAEPPAGMRPESEAGFEAKSSKREAVGELRSTPAAAKPAMADRARMDPQTVDLSLERIRRLRAQGHEEDAAKALKDLLDMQPDLVVPADLRDLLGETPR